LIRPPVYVWTFCKVPLLLTTGFFLLRLEFKKPSLLLEFECESTRFFLNFGLVLLKGSLKCLVALLIYDVIPCDF